jgi:hypothetical protein
MGASIGVQGAFVRMSASLGVGTTMSFSLGFSHRWTGLRDAAPKQGGYAALDAPAGATPHTTRATVRAAIAPRHFPDTRAPLIAFVAAPADGDRNVWAIAPTMLAVNYFLPFFTFFWAR